MEIDPLKQQATVKGLEVCARAAGELLWAKQQFERSQSLFNAGVVSKQDLDQAKSAYDAAQAQMDSSTHKSMSSRCSCTITRSLLRAEELRETFRCAKETG